MRESKQDVITREFIIQKWVRERLSQKEIAEIVGVHVGTIEKYVKLYKLKGYRDKVKYPVRKASINYNSPIFWYFIGLVISDGHVNVKGSRISISLVDDEEILIELSKYFSCAIRPIPITKTKTVFNKNVYTLHISSKDLVEQFLDLLQIRDKSKTNCVYVPEAPNRECGLMLLRGIIDGDGSIKYSKTETVFFEIYSHSPYMIESFIREYTKWLNAEIYVYPVKNKTGKCLHSKSSDFSLIEIYNDYPEICLQRKRNKIKKLVDDIVHHYEMINRNNW